MKKIIIMAVAVLMPMFGFAQSKCWKGFIDFNVGSSFGEDMESLDTKYEHLEDFKVNLTFGLNVTGGYQITPYLFTGVGFGVYTAKLDYKEIGSSGYENWHENKFYAVYLPVYADVRWTLDLNRKINPFVDLKVGYQFGVPTTADDLDWGPESYRVECRNGLYFVPSVGVRFGRASAFNLGIAYNANIGRQYMRYENDVFKKSSKGALLLTFGADF